MGVGVGVLSRHDFCQCLSLQCSGCLYKRSLLFDNAFAQSAEHGIGSVVREFKRNVTNHSSDTGVHCSCAWISSILRMENGNNGNNRTILYNYVKVVSIG